MSQRFAIEQAGRRGHGEIKAGKHLEKFLHRRKQQRIAVDTQSFIEGRLLHGFETRAGFVRNVV